MVEREDSMYIEVIDLCKKYGDIAVLDNLNLKFECGNINCIMGVSGCGKTTFLNIFMGILKADSGKILGIKDKIISAVFQEDRLCENFNSIQNIKLICLKSVSETEIKQHLNSVGLFEAIYKPVSSLSKGMKRRTAIVRAMMYKSDILVMDEPFDGLDNLTKLNTIEYIKSNLNNRTLIFVTHNREDILKFNSKNIFKMS